MANYVYIATSLDGFIATEDDGLAWLEQFPNPDNEDYGFNEFIDQIDALLMGRRTYEKVLTFDEWPYTKPVFVLSHHLLSIPESLKNKVFIANGQLPHLIESLNEKGYQNLYIDGGATITGFLNEDLIDQLIITRLPLLLGRGIPLFGHLHKSLKFEHHQTRLYPNGLVQSHYIRQHQAG